MILLLLLFTAPANTAVAEDGTCGGLTTCSACAANDDCTWCPKSNSCIASATVSQICFLDEKAGEPISNPDYCSSADPFTRFSNCTACMGASPDDGDIGWCPSEGRCYYGTRYGPLNHTCLDNEANGTWTYSDPKYCAGTQPTATYTNCTSCMTLGDPENGDIGWCPSEGRCYYGSRDGPANHTCLDNEANGTWTYSDAKYCAGTQPTATYTNCTSCMTLGEPETGYVGWCPSDGKCYFGTKDGGPANKTCAASAFNGSWVTDSCNANPSMHHNCSTCITSSSQNGWCPTSRQCFFTVDGALINHTTCNTSMAVGGFTSDCNCLFPYQKRDEGGCKSCSNQNFEWCWYAQECRAQQQPGVSSCPSTQCPSNCVCAPGSSDCLACRQGFVGVDTHCVEVCPANLRDCLDTNRSLARTQCALGFTNFPLCDQKCDPKCIGCRGSYLNSTGTPDQCLLCAQVGAMAPNCLECMPHVCKDSSGTCSQPCDEGKASQVNGSATLSWPRGPKVKSSWLGCDTCHAGFTAVDWGLEAGEEYVNEALETEESVKVQAAAFDTTCVAALSWFAPAETICVTIITVEAGVVFETSVLKTVLMGANYIWNHLPDSWKEPVEDFLCETLLQCKHPCSPGRHVLLTQRSKSLQHGLSNMLNHSDNLSTSQLPQMAFI